MVLETRQANGDQSTDRSTKWRNRWLRVYQDTEEHRELLQNYPEQGFFKDPAELADRVKKCWLIQSYKSN